jgi:tetratricopeptide (TPR) repeat protein
LRAAGDGSVGSGLAALLTGDGNNARRSLTRAVEIEPASAPAHVGLGRYFTAIRRYHDAKAEFERAAKLDTLSPERRFTGVAYVQAACRRSDPRLHSGAGARRPGLARGAQAALERYRAAGVPPSTRR